MSSRVRSTTLAVLPLAFLFMLTGVNVDANTLNQANDDLQVITDKELTSQDQQAIE